MRLFSPRTLATLWSVLIAIGLTLPGSALPGASLFEYDKLVHGALFLVLALLWLAAGSRGRLDRGLGIFAIILAFSVITELYQGMLPFDRHPDMYDSAADAIGAVIGFGLWLPLRARLDRWSERSRRAPVGEGGKT
ncbi:MAG: VanZ family protein [Bacteroidota bacterium]|nr:VanZ family protein [Bacteroidota bacterium]